VLEHAPNAILLVSSNPVDVMTHLAADVAAEFGVPSHRVLGSGTTLDTARLRALLAQKLDIDAMHVHAYVLGEHGDSEMIPWSQITVGVIPLREFCDQWDLCVEEEDQKEIEEQVRNAAYQIIEGKGATYYGVGSAIAKIVEVILGNQRALLTVCTPLDSFAGCDRVTISMPHLVGGDGILNTLQMPLTPDEEKALFHSASVVHTAIQELQKAS
jgi:L-lactate dehydrogenase